MKIGIFTPRSLNPLHPRLWFFKHYFHEHGLQVDFINESNYARNITSRFNWLVLWFFDLYAIKKCKKKIGAYDLVIVTDLKYLPLVKAARKQGKIVFYDTIDHNVALRSYQLLQKLPLLKPFREIIMKIFIAAEKSFAAKYCDEVIVNSKALHSYFNKQATVIHYSSPFESVALNNDASLPAALLYLGAFRRDKGADKIMQMHLQLNIPLFIYGPVEDDNLLQQVRKLPNVAYQAKLSIEALQKELIALGTKYFLFGFSLIEPAHLSYEIQEANKDIDYLALAIPVIGNYRTPTREKIEAGCGIFFDDPALGQKMLDVQIRAQQTNACNLYYASHYHSGIARKNLDSLMSRYFSGFLKNQ